MCVCKSIVKICCPLPKICHKSIVLLLLFLLLFVYLFYFIVIFSPGISLPPAFFMKTLLWLCVLLHRSGTSTDYSQQTSMVIENNDEIQQRRVA